jgi:inosine/xanthosine triphosphate pyrophosphatase family protein
MKLFVSTTSPLKLQHYRVFFEPLGYQIEPVLLEIPELQHIEPEQVVREKLRMACMQTTLRPLLVDDVGLSVPSFQGFPGALLKPILELGGLRLLRDLTSGKTENGCIAGEFTCAIAAEWGQSASLLFAQGRMQGTLNFTNEQFLEDRATLRCFYQQGSSLSLAELAQKDPRAAFAHRFLALEQLVQQFPQL